MLSSEAKRSRHQRVIPLSSQLVKDMLAYEGREYQSLQKTNKDGTALKRKSSLSKQIRDKLRDTPIDSNETDSETDNQLEASLTYQMHNNEDIDQDDGQEIPLRKFRSSTDISYTR